LDSFPGGGTNAPLYLKTILRAPWSLSWLGVIIVLGPSFEPMMTTAAATARLIADAGIERVFGLPGGEVLVLMDALRKAGVDFVLMRHEANAGIAAAVYGKLRGQPGVVVTTLGPGAANL